MVAKPTAGLLDHLARWWVIGLLIAAAFGMIKVFQVRGDILAQWSGFHDPILDAQFGYTPAFAYERIRAIGEGGRQLYALTQLTLDMAFPFTYSLLASLLIVRVYHPIANKAWAWRLRYLPWVNGAVDALENLSIVALLWAFPTELPMLAIFASIVGVLKWALGGAVLAALGLGLIRRLL